jgi:polysaccharide biosynthesis transport protein
MSEMTTPATGSLKGLAALGPTAEVLWSRIALGRSKGALRRILFVGSEHGCGTSSIACSTAAGLARNLQARVTLVEVGAGSSTLASILGLPEGPGLYDLLCANASLQGCVRNCGLERLGVVTAGRGALPAGLIASELARRVFEQLGAGNDFLLIDAPPIQEHPELTTILQHADEAVLVLEAEHTQRERAQELMNTINRSGVRILGSVLNRSSVPPSR